MEIEVSNYKATAAAIVACRLDRKMCPPHVNQELFDKCGALNDAQLEDSYRQMLDDKKRVDDQQKCVDDQQKRVDDQQKCVDDQRKCVDDQRKCIDDHRKMIYDNRQEIRELNAKQEHIERELCKVDYAVAASKSKSEMIFPNTHCMTERFGRRGFDTSLKRAIEEILALTQQNDLVPQQATSIILQCASGVGKTFVCNTFRRGQLRLGVNYFPLCVYLGLNQGFPLTTDENKMLHQGDESLLRSVLFQRLVFALKGIVDAAEEKASMREVHPLEAVLDGDRSEWLQKLPFPTESSFQYHNIRDPDETQHIVELLKKLHSYARKRLVILVCLDEAQLVDDNCPIKVLGEPQGARFALRILRELQVKVFNTTNHQVLLMPIAIGINANVFLSNPTAGNHVVLGKDDEALLEFDDFKLLVKDRLEKRKVSSISNRFLHLIATAHYPHVRSTVTQDLMTASNLACATKLSKRDVREIVNAAFMESVVDFQACNFPGGVIPAKQSTETTGVPVLSFKTWSSLHDRLFEGELCPSMPTQIVDGSWIHHAQHWASFEHRCFSTLRYFFEVFGPVDKNSLHQADTSKQNGIRGPLQQWIPTTNFMLCSEFSGVLEEAEGRYNPFTCPTTSKHENIPEYPLTDEFSAMLKTAVTKVRHSPGVVGQMRRKGTHGLHFGIASCEQ